MARKKPEVTINAATHIQTVPQDHDSVVTLHMRVLDSTKLVDAQDERIQGMLALNAELERNAANQRVRLSTLLAEREHLRDHVRIVNERFSTVDHLAASRGRELRALAEDVNMLEDAHAGDLAQLQVSHRTQLEQLRAINHADVNRLLAANAKDKASRLAQLERFRGERDALVESLGLMRSQRDAARALSRQLSRRLAERPRWWER